MLGGNICTHFEGLHDHALEFDDPSRLEVPPLASSRMEPSTFFCAEMFGNNGTSLAILLSTTCACTDSPSYSSPPRGK